MGTFMGHALPGTFFIVLSAWWYLGALIQNKHSSRQTDSRSLLGAEQGSVSRRKRKRNFNQQPWFYCTGNNLLSKLPVEPIVKVILAILGILLELFPDHEYALTDTHGEFIETNLNNYGHSTMYAFFALSGIIDLLMWHKRLPLPPGLDYLSLAVAFLVEGMLFVFHLDGRPQLDARIHIMLYIIIFATAIAICIEMLWEKSILFSTVRAYLTALQGTWFYQIAFTLHGPKPWKNIPSNVMFLSIAFAWHVLFVFAAFLGFFAVFYRLCAKRFLTQDSCLGREERQEEDDDEEIESIAMNTL